MKFNVVIGIGVSTLDSNQSTALPEFLESGSFTAPTEWIKQLLDHNGARGGIRTHISESSHDTLRRSVSSIAMDTCWARPNFNASGFVNSASIFLKTALTHKWCLKQESNLRIVSETVGGIIPYQFPVRNPLAG